MAPFPNTDELLLLLLLCGVIIFPQIARALQERSQRNSQTPKDTQ